MTLFRPHRGGLAEAMAEVKEVADRGALISHLAQTWEKGGMGLISKMEIVPYGYDTRIEWNTHIVTAVLDGAYGTGRIVLGFTNGPLS